MRLLGLGLLALLGLLLLASQASATKQHFKHTHNQDQQPQDEGQWDRKAKKGRKQGREQQGEDGPQEEQDNFGPGQIAPQFGVNGRVYRFRYDAQSSSGYAPWISTQRAMSRFQALINVRFVSGQEAVMRVSECLAGQLNAKPMGQGTGMGLQPMESFESNAKFQHEELERPVRFSYDQGSIEKIRFHPEEQAWSRNVKKAVLNLLQVQLAREKVQAERDPVERRMDRELEQQTGTIGGRPQQQQKETRRWNGQMQKSFTLNEMTIEGECECIYSIVPAGAELVNVTKTVNFDRCQMLADTAFGMQADEEAKQRGEQKPSMDYQQDRLGHVAMDDVASAEWRNRSASPMIATQLLDRSTTIRYVLSKHQQKQQQAGSTKGEEKQPGLDAYGIQHVELVSQYVLKSSDAEASQAQQTVAIARLRFLDASSSNGRRERGQEAEGRKDNEEGTFEEEGESLMYNADMESQEKCFYMFGDDSSDERRCPVHVQRDGKTAFSTPYPFNYPSSGKKVARAVQLVQLVAQAQRQQGNAEQEPEKQAMNTAENLDELVTIMRFCSEKELEQLQSKLTAEGSSQAQQFFADALAASGTRNTLKLLLKRIEAGDFADLRAAQLMKIFSRGSGLPAPSDKIVDLLLALCKRPRVQQSSVLKQACWLSFGAIVGELNQQQRIVRHSPVRTPASHYESSPGHKLELYTEALLEQFKSAGNDQLYERVIALKAIGNAALDSVPEALVDCISRGQEEAEQGDKVNRKQTEIIRTNAIEATRRIPSPKVQRLLLPVYLDQAEVPLIRATALSVLLQGQLSPSQGALDQIAFALGQESCPQVLSFTQTMLAEMARSPAKRHRKIAQHVKAMLKLTGVDERELEAKCRGAASKFSRFTGAYSQTEQTGIFVDMAKVYTHRSAGSPSHSWISLTSLLNGQIVEQKMQLTLCQNNLERFFQQAMKMGGQTEEEERTADEGQQKESPSDSGPPYSSSSSSYFSTAKQQLQTMWKSLKGMAVKSEPGEKMRKDPVLVASLRVNNVDTVVLQLGGDGSDGRSPVELLKRMLAMAGARSAAEYASQGEEKPAMDLNGIIFWQERSARVPTSTGQQLSIQQKSAAFGQIQANARQLGRAQFSMEFRPALTYARLQKMKCWASPMHASGVKHILAMEVTVPLGVQLSVQPQQQQVKFAFRVPQSATRLFAFHTLPMTFVSEIENERQQQQQLASDSARAGARYHHSERVRSVQNKQLQDHQFSVDRTVYQSMGLPIHVQGILHRPRRFSQLKEWAKVVLAAENHYHVDFEPKPGRSPREIALTIGWQLFELHPNTPGNSMESKLAEFMRKFEGEGAGEEQQQDEEQRMSADGKYKYALEVIKKYAQQKAFKHTLKYTLETVGGEQNKRAELQLESVCNVISTACDARAQIRCTSGGPNEPAEWQADAQMHLILPVSAIDLEHMPVPEREERAGREEAQKHFKLFIGTAEAEWAARGAQKQFVKLDLKGEPSLEMLQLLRDFIRANNSAALNPLSNGRSTAQIRLLQMPGNAARPFVNSYEAVAEYKLAPEAVNFFQRCMEMAKMQHFMNSQSRLVVPANGQQRQQQDDIGSQQEGQIRASFAIDPVTQRHVNASIRTDRQLVTFHQIELASTFRPLPMVQSQPQQQQSAGAQHPSQSVRPSTSLKQAIQKQLGHQLRNRAECTLDSRREQLETFDGVQSVAPISKCWTVLAKHCGRAEQAAGGGEAPEFAVLVKSIPGSQQKKLKVVSPEMGIIVIEPREQQSQGQGDEQGTEQNIQRRNMLQVRIDKDGQQQQQQPILSDMLPSQIPDGIEFAQSTDGTHETVIIESEQGHVQVRFNGQIVRIRLSGAEYQNAQCGLCGNWDGDRANDMTRLPSGGNAQNVQQFQRAYAIEEEAQAGCSPQALDQFYMERKDKFQPQDAQFGEAGDESVEIAPRERTAVLEYREQLCFSKQAVKQCPVGSFASTSAGPADHDGQLGRELRQQKVPFTCVQRSSLEAKRLKQQARRGEPIQMADYPVTFQEFVVVPERCIKY